MIAVRNIYGDNLFIVFRNLLAEISAIGHLVKSDGILTKEIQGITLKITNPRLKIIRHSSINYPLIFHKQLQWLAGKEDNQSNTYFEERFTKGNKNVNSAAYLFDDIHPPVFLDQFKNIYTLLEQNPFSRQAYMDVFFHRMAKLNKGTRMSILLGLHFLCREDKLHLIVYMRSNEIWKGFLSDVYLFSFLHEVMAAWLGKETGTYSHFIGSCHIYENNFELVESFLTLSKNEPDWIDISPLKFDKTFQETLTWVQSMIETELEIRNGKAWANTLNLKDKYSNWYLNWFKA